MIIAMLLLLIVTHIIAATLDIFALIMMLSYCYGQLYYVIIML